MTFPVIDYLYHNHILMTGNTHSFLPNDDWVYDSRTIQTMIKTQNQYINYTFLLRSMIFKDATGELIIAYDIETV